MVGWCYANMVIAIVLVGVFASMILSIYSFIQQQEALAASVSDIREQYLQSAHDSLEAGNTTGAIRDILAILDWEFNEFHPGIESYLGNVTITASG